MVMQEMKVLQCATRRVRRIGGAKATQIPYLNREESTRTLSGRAAEAARAEPTC